MPPPPTGTEPTPFVRPGSSPRWPLILSIVGVVAAVAVIVVALLPLFGDDDDPAVVETATSVSAPAATDGSAVASSTTAAESSTTAAVTTSTAATDTSGVGSTAVVAPPSSTGNDATTTTGNATTSVPSSGSSSTTVSSSPSTTASGFPRPVNVALVEATCTAPDSTDSRGNRITFNPLLTYDGIADTAWRCPGASIHQALLFTLASPSDVSAVAALPGYDGADPYNRIDRWDQNRRVTKARWACLDATGKEVGSAEQSFTDRRENQGITVTGFTKCTKVIFELLETSAPGNRDNAAVSEIGIYGPV